MDGIAETQAAVGELLTAFEAFKEANDRRLDEIERKGAPDPLTEDKVERIGRRLDDIETMQARAPRASGAEHDRGRVAWSQRDDGAAFLHLLRRGREQLEPAEVKALVLSDDTLGGYLAPPEYVREIIKGVTEVSPLRSVARVRQTTQRHIQLPRRTGSFAAEWTAETGTRSETTGLTFGLEEIPTHEMYALVDVSFQMLEDAAFDIEAELTAEFADRFALAEGTAFVTGTGVGRPEGLLSNGDVAFTVSGSAATIADGTGQANGLIDLYHDIPTAYAREGSWLLNRSTLGSVRRLKDGSNNYVWQPGLGEARPNTILGAPYVEVPDMPDEAAGAFPIAFGDVRRAYTIVDRVQMSVLRDPFSQQTAGKVRFHARRRVGGQVVLADAIRKLQCSV